MTDQEKKDRWDEAEKDWALAQAKIRAFFVDPAYKDEDYAQAFIRQVENLYKSHVIRAMFPKSSQLADAIIQMRQRDARWPITAPSVRKAFGQKLRLTDVMRPSISRPKPKPTDLFETSKGAVFTREQLEELNVEL